MEDILNNLNKEQIKAVVDTEGAILVLAGAGTGKTRVLTSKIAYIIKSNLAFPSQILAVTFTNKAANEMKERVANMTGLDINSMWINTFHSIAARILRQNGELIGIKQDFMIADQGEQTSIVKQILTDFKLDLKENPPKSYVEAITRTKDKLPSYASKLYQFNDVLRIYNEKLKSNNMCDFSDLLNYNIELLSKNKDVKKYYNDKFKYILVDEYQDTNAVQNVWLKLISGVEDGKKVNITCVGDDDQSIYGWRGAEIKNILSFKNDFKKAEIIKLERNYRSTQNILDVAYSVISNNKNRHGKKLYAETNLSNEKVTLIKCNSINNEATTIVNEIEILKNSNYLKQYKNCAVLVRAGYQTRILEDIFLKSGIPYIIIGGQKFYERKEIKDCIYYLRLINNQNDDLAFEKIINVPKRGIGAASIEKIRNFSIENKISLLKSVEIMTNNGLLKGNAKDEILMFLNNLEKWKKFEGTLKDLMSLVLDSIKYIEFMEKDEETRNKIDNIEEFLNTLNDFSDINSFLEHVSLVSDNNEKNIVDAVNIMTIHAAKGLEFDVVFLPNWHDGVFPSPRSMEEEGGLEEERRLAYVAITRAKKKLYISNSKYKYDRTDGIINLEPSKFIYELPINSMKVIDNIDKNSYNNFYDKNNTYNTYNRSFEKVSYSLETPKIENFKRCYHEKFGYGYVLKQNGNKLTIAFENCGTKIILENFVNFV